MAGHHELLYWCDDDKVLFTIRKKGFRGRKSIHCPLCGDSIAVRRVTNMKKEWLPKEDEKLITLAHEGISPMQIAAKLGRSREAVIARAKHLRKSHDIPRLGTKK